MKTIRLLFTHLAVAALAFVAFRSVASTHHGEAVAASSNASAVRTSTGKSARSSSTRASVRAESAVFQDAWNAIPAKKLSPHERIQLQVELLNRWAEKDLDGAIAAALKESWDDAPGWSGGIEKLLTDGFGQVFLDRPDDVWEMIREKRFGILGSALIRNAWAQALSAKDPSLLASYLPEMQGTVFKDTLSALTVNMKTPDQARELWQRLSDRTQWEGGDVDLLEPVADNLVRFLDAPEIREIMGKSDGPLAATACAMLARKLMYGNNPPELETALADVPDDLKGRFAFETLKAVRFENSGMVRDAVNHLAAGQQWEYLGKQEVSGLMGWLANTDGPQEVAEWVCSLPPHPQTTEIFHRGVEPFIRKDRGAAIGWIASIDDPVWRDRGYAEYSQQCLRRFNDPDASRQALDQIADPAFKLTAESWRKSWERETGWKEN